jgi:Icc-related predicted phosphoesterase
LRIYFCSDIHGSRKCWKKFLAASKFYEADVIVVGGDITGKMVVPIIKQHRGHWTARFMGVERYLETVDEVSKLKTRMADAGQYSFETNVDEYAWYCEDQARVDELLHRLIVERVEEWVHEADEKLTGTEVRCFVSGGNDDFFEIDQVLAESRAIEDPNGKVLALDGGLEFLGMGYGNPTPWPSPRDIAEEELGMRIDEAAAKVADIGRCIFSLHVPPHGSGLDLAPRLDEELRMVLSAAGPEMIHVGSHATRDAIVKYKPMAGLHGHVHESKGIQRLANVPIANPGSEYAEGVLNGLIVEINRKGVRRIDPVTG